MSRCEHDDDDPHLFGAIVLALPSPFLLFLFWQVPPVCRRARVRRKPNDSRQSSVPDSGPLSPDDGRPSHAALDRPTTSIRLTSPTWRRSRSTPALLFSDVCIETHRRAERDSLPGAPREGCRRDEAAHRAVPDRRPSHLRLRWLPGWFCRASLKQPISLGVVDELLYSARRASANLPARAEPPQGTDRRHGSGPSSNRPSRAGILRFLQRQTRRSLRRRDIDGHVRPPAARRGELRPRAE